ncbi:MAG: AbrB/MazE/SpoVT family DNA-binding domain-containing protein [Promethearchaeota archaeon]
MTIQPEREYVVKVGSKGEIFPPKPLREELGLTGGQPVILSVEGDTLVVRKLHSLEEILKRGTKVKVSYHAMKEARRELNREFEGQ